MMAATAPNPKDSMKSTWARADRSTWTTAHKVLFALNPFVLDPNKPAPVFQKTDPMPVLTRWSTHAFILLHAAWPMAIQAGYYYAVGRNMHPVAVVILYTLAFQVNAIHEVNCLHRIGQKVGYLDGDKHVRDEVPDVGVQKALLSVELTTVIRPIFTIFLSYNTTQAPSLSPWLPVELFLYSIILDFWFYVWHRSSHEIPFLWRLHRTHHLTKHPNPLLSAYSDAEQEVIEIALVPLATYATLRLFGFPMGFYDWWVCHQYLLFSEAFGHSGLRVFASTPGVSSPILELFGCELVLEDHDLHHRRGWRKAANYGKQTRLWDKIFGTCTERIESHSVDRNYKVDMPLW